ncbi:MAG: M16 family metallopeptidase, partial [Longimicrobiales bacterium]
EIESLGGAIGPSAGADLFNWGVGVPRQHFARSLDLLADAALAPVFAADEVERERTVALSDLEQLRDDMARYPMRLLFSAAFGEHPYGTSIETVESSLRALVRDDVVRWHQERVLNGEPWVFIVGDVDPDEAAREVEQRLAVVRAVPATDRVGAPAWPAAPVTTTAARDKAQTALAIGFPGVSRNAPEYQPLQLLSAAIAGLGGPLFEELRSRRSLAYSVAAYPVARLLGGAFVGYIGTSPEREDEAREGLIAELLRWTREELDPAELVRAKRYTIGTWHIRSQTNGAQLANLTTAFLLGEGLDEIREFESRVAGITAPQIREAAEACFDPARLVTAIVRGTGKAR